MYLPLFSQAFWWSYNVDLKIKPLNKLHIFIQITDLLGKIDLFNAGRLRPEVFSIRGVHGRNYRDTLKKKNIKNLLAYGKI
jgi:hypothetical protein